MSKCVLYINGELRPLYTPHISALDRGFTLGDGVFETMRLVGGRVFQLGRHLERLRRSAAVIELPVPMDDRLLEHAIARTVEANGLQEGVVRVTLTRGATEQRGLLPPATCIPTLAIWAMPFAGYPPEKYHHGAMACISRIRRNETSPSSTIKSCSCLDNVLARKEAAARRVDEALMLNIAGHLAGGASSNVYLVMGRTVLTPPSSSGALPGITRAVIRDLVPKLGLLWQERALAVEDLAQADEAFLTNALMGIMPLVSVDGRPIGRELPGPVTSDLSGAYQDLLGSFARGWP